ncbi:hypothetical protein WEH80_10890 [Actinomycetes bacterium KLBMP 9759]
MDASDDTGTASSAPTDGGGAPPSPPSLGPDAVAILSTEHWSLLSSRSLIWSEAMNRSTVFLSLLSATIVALALLADANDFGRQTTTLALVLLPIVLLLGVVTHVRLVQINSEEVRTMLAMNRLRNAYLEIAPNLKPYFSTGFHDDERGLAASYLMAGARRMRPWRQFLQAMATLVATVDAVLAASIVVIAVQASGASTGVTVAAGVPVFLAVWVALVVAQRQALHPLRRLAPRFPSPAGD